ncbi:MAG: ATP-binding cassette domain-containing protein [Acidobacteria bacterium]|nr:ATP-binding cassette domain-containing protein [Acidobacteriota bacterium]
MPSLHLVDLSFGHTSAVPIFDDVTVHLGPGWHGLVGANGSGKTTLLRLVTGELEPVSGIVRVEPVQPSPTLCHQSVEHRTDEISSFAASGEGHARELHGRLGLNPTDLERWPTLSPGERKRWQIGAALAARPLVLLLDEPTNHLDREGRGILFDALRRFPGVGVIVSHDRHFLDSLTSSTLLVAGGSVRQWNAPYSQARQAWEAEAAQREEHLETAKREARKLLESRLRPINDGRHRPQSTSMFAAFVAEHFEPAVLPTLKLSTQQVYRVLLRKHLLPRFGNQRLCDIRREEVQRFALEKLQQGQSWESANKLRNLLSKVLGTAVSWGYLAENPVRGVKMPERTLKRPHTFLSVDEVRRLLSVLDQPERTIVLLATLTGLSIGEMLALRWGWSAVPQPRMWGEAPVVSGCRRIRHPAPARTDGRKDRRGSRW